MKSYLVRVAPMRAPEAWRRFELSEDRTLEDLRALIHAEFGLARAPEQAFFLSGISFDRDSEYGDPWRRAARRMDRAPAGRLALRRGKRFLYLARYPDRLMLWHEARVEEVREGEPGVARVAGTSGRAAPPCEAPLRDGVPFATVEPEDGSPLTHRIWGAVRAWGEQSGAGTRSRDQILRDLRTAMELWGSLKEMEEEELDEGDEDLPGDLMLWLGDLYRELEERGLHDEADALAARYPVGPPPERSQEGGRGSPPLDAASLFRLALEDEDGEMQDLPVGIKVGRNEPCPCGSGRKFKKCCGTSGGRVEPERLLTLRVLTSLLAGALARQDWESESQQALVSAWGEEFRGLSLEEAVPLAGPEDLRLFFIEWLLLDRPRGDGRTFAEGWMEECGRLLGHRARRVLERLAASRLGLYQILPGEDDWTTRLGDLLRGGTVEFPEESRHPRFAVWDVVAARIVELDGAPFLMPGHVKLPATAKAALREGLRGAGDETGRARLFLEHARRLHDDPPADAVTLSGEPVERMRAFYRVREPEVAAALLGSARGIAEHDECPCRYLWEGPERAGRGEGAAPRALGALGLEGDRLVLECLSRERLEEGKTFLASRLGPRIEHQEDRAFPLHQGAASLLEWSRAFEGLIEPDHEDALFLCFLEGQFEGWLDRRLPALGGRTPREASDTPEGRGLLAEWLRAAENRDARRARSRWPEYDFDTLWDEARLHHEEGL